MAQKNEDSDFLLYENHIQKISIQYPSNWSKTDNAELGTNPIVIFSPPQEGFSKIFIETKSLSFGNISLSEYSNQQINRLDHLLLDFHLTELSSTTIGKKNAEKVVYTFMLQNIPFRKMEIWIVKDTKVYTINYLAEEPKYHIYLPTIERMIDSFQINDKLS